VFHGGQKYDADAKVEGGGAGVRGNFLACLTLRAMESMDSMGGTRL
jgi:hypothetical protein